VSLFDRPIDLHTHTDRSDGSSDPIALVREAVALGLEALAIADHDTLDGYVAAVDEARRLGLELICAVELSTRPEGPSPSGAHLKSVHMLGYFIGDPPSREFCDWLQRQQASRRKRNSALVENLRRLGIDIALEDAQAYGRDQVGRPHFARLLFERGYVSSLQEAFDLYLADGAKAAVEREEPGLEEGIRRIADAGGLASLAHPVRLPWNGRELATRILQMKRAGLRGIEVFHSEHSPADTDAYAELARELDLIPTGGTDFHGENKPGIRLGSGLNGNIRLDYSLLQRMRDMFGDTRLAAMAGGI
jgi:predicted metal-dependent phosphoesterase TrpH